MEGQKKEKQTNKHFIKGGMVAAFFVGDFFMRIISFLTITLESTTFNIILTSKTALSCDKAVFN